MTAPDLISHVNEAIAKALRGESYIDASVLKINGFSTATQRHLVSNLTWKIRAYLECGLFAGATFCAALHPDLFAVGIEDWSQPFGEANIQAEFNNNFMCHRHRAGEYQIAIANCFEVTPNFGKPIECFYYDAQHDFESQAKALPHFIDAMADTFLYMVDDFAWEPVNTGTRAGFDALAGKIKIEQEWILSDGVPDGPLWHNDVLVAVISKV